MVRYARLYLCFIRFAFSRALEFRFDFFFRILMDIVFYVVTLAFFGVLYRHTALMGGWTLDQTIVFAAGFMFCDAVYMTVFSSGLWWFPFRINRGDLDYYLVRPVSPMFFLILREFAANSFLNLLIAIGFLGWAIARYPVFPGVPGIVLFCLLLVSGSVLTALISLAFLIPTFWTGSHEGLRSIMFHISDYAERPHTIYPTWARRILLTVLPCALISSLPTLILFEGLTTGRLLHIALVFGGMSAFVGLLWKRGLRAYSSASS